MRSVAKRPGLAIKDHRPGRKFGLPVEPASEAMAAFTLSVSEPIRVRCHGCRGCHGWLGWLGRGWPFRSQPSVNHVGPDRLPCVTMSDKAKNDRAIELRPPRGRREA